MVADLHPVGLALAGETHEDGPISLSFGVIEEDKYKVYLYLPRDGKKMVATELLQERLIDSYEEAISDHLVGEAALPIILKELFGVVDLES